MALFLFMLFLPSRPLSSVLEHSLRWPILLLIFSPFSSFGTLTCILETLDTHTFLSLL